MFSSHYNKRLSAYCNGETTAEESQRIADHLTSCERCRREYEQIKLGVDLATQLSMAEAPDEIWSDIQRLLASESVGSRGTARVDLRRYRLALTVALALLVVAVGAIAWWRMSRTVKAPQLTQNNQPTPLPEQKPENSWQVETKGAVKVGSASVSEKGLMAVGEVLETGENSTARINVGDIGHVDVEPNTRIRLVDTRTTEHRLALDRGTLHAKIIAPPRLFFVDTPSAEAVDLGCAYTLQVDDQGRSFLHVTSGWVSLVRQDTESFVPLGAMCQTRPVIGPGTPYFEDASAEFIGALERFDFADGGDESLAVILNQARDRDTMTLWHLLQRVRAEQRPAVVNRIAALVRLPKGVTKAGLMRLDKRMMELERWQDAMDTIWF